MLARRIRRPAEKVGDNEERIHLKVESLKRKAKSQRPKV